jgi:hypothetical protein
MRAVVDIIGDVVSKTSAAVQQKHGFDVFYHYGHAKDIQELVLSYAQTEQFRKKRYPAVLLLQDFVERSNRSAGMERQVDLQLIIVAESGANYRPEIRYDKVFKPILYPIYEEFMRVINRSGGTFMIPYSGFPHDKIDRLRLTEALMGAGVKFADFLDGIELRNLSISILKEQCY